MTNAAANIIPAEWKSISLEAMNEKAAMQTRVDRKYIVDAETAAKSHIEDAEREKQRIISDARKAAQAEKNKVLQEANAQIEEMVSAAVDKLLVPAGSAFDSFDDSGKE